MSRWLACLVVAASAWLPAQAAVTPEQQKAIRAATFEVVMKKPEKDPLSYAKPLPLELLPFQERTDAYQSIGTAFTLGNNTYVTAGHVLLAGIGSQYGAPALRSASGKVWAIDRILKFSVHEDFVVFSVVGDSGASGFATNRMPQVDDTVLAVGNALGEGVVIRDGLFTSETPEDQDGRWKWIRFSAAASPGNSGGPLLDAESRVVGIVIGKSANENLNYGLPIGRVLDAPAGRARFDQRVLATVPWLHGGRTYSYQDGFDLPLSWPGFSVAYRSVVARHAAAARAEVFKDHAATLFPRGKGTEALLYDADANGFLPWLVVQQQDDSWSAFQPYFNTVELAGDGAVRMANVAPGTELLRVRRPDNAADDAFYGDSRQFMDLALKGLNVRRPVGPDEVAVTSAGTATEDSVYVDGHGRRWQLRAWPLPFIDSWIITLMLPVPDGYSGLVQYAPSSRLEEARDQIRQYAGQMEVSYRGTLNQWRAFLARASLLPDALKGLKLGGSPDWTITTPRMRMTVPPALFKPDGESVLALTMGFQPDVTSADWGINDLWLYRDNQVRSGFGTWRRARPPASARPELRNNYADMFERRGSYNGSFVREASDYLAIATAIDAPGSKAGQVSADLLYGVGAHVETGRADTNEMLLKQALASAVRIDEHGGGRELSAAELVSEPERQQLRAASYNLSQSLLDEARKRDYAATPDLRGRVIADDLGDYITATSPSSVPPSYEVLRARAQLLHEYWSLVPMVKAHRDNWLGFVAMNKVALPESRKREIQAAEEALLATLKTEPDSQWASAAKALVSAYDTAKQASLSVVRRAQLLWRPREGACHPRTQPTSGESTAMLLPGASLYDAYPKKLRELEVEATAAVAVRVSAEGCAQAGAIEVSTGSADWDQAILKWFDGAWFLPAESGGKAVESVKKIKLAFRRYPDRTEVLE